MMIATGLLTLILNSAAPLLPAVEAGKPASALRQAPNSPVRLFGLINRQRPYPYDIPWFSEAELDVLAHRFDVISGLDGHGYSFPGALSAIRGINPDITSFCHWEAMGVQADGERFAALDIHEEAFIHSADPASLRAVSQEGKTVIWFRQDARNRVQSANYSPPGVISYRVEYGSSVNGPFTLLGSPVFETGSFVYRTEDSNPEPGRYYRVRSRLLDGTLVDYSWPVTANPSAQTVIAVALLLPGGEMLALCYGQCPEDPAQLAIDADVNNDYIFHESERLPFTAVDLGIDDSRVYSGSLDPKIITGLYGYRAVAVADPSLSDPIVGTYQMGLYNNRVQMREFSAYLVWPMHPVWLALAKQRLSDALALGYSGMNLDFALDTLQQGWTATGLPPDWQGPDDPRIYEQMDQFLAELAAHEPDAPLVFNGRFVNSRVENYDQYLSRSAGALFEFFGIGEDPHGTLLQPNTVTAVEGAWANRSLGKAALLVAAADRENHVGRLKSLAMYLLIADSQVYFYNSIDPATQEVVHFPEWDVPLGTPLEQVNSWDDILVPNGFFLMARQYSSGLVLFNANVVPMDIPFDPPMRLLSITGGLSEAIGGDGRVDYAEVSSVTLQPGDAAILLKITDDCEHPTCQRYGDVFPDSNDSESGGFVGNCIVDVDDITCALDGFAGSEPCRTNADVIPCPSPNGILDVDDISAILDAFAGFLHPPCQHPCGGACCASDGSCTITASADCGGTYAGDGLDCFQVPSPCP